MAMMRNKKGFFFTMLAIVFIAIFIVVFTSPTTITQQEYIKAGRIEGAALNQLTQDMKYVYLETAMEASTKAALRALIEYNEYRYLDTGDEGVQDLDEEFNLAMQESGSLQTIDLTSDEDYDLQMEMSFKAEIDEINVNLATAPIDGQVFGGDHVFVQGIYFPVDDYPDANWSDYYLDTVTLFIEHASGDDKNLSLMVYEEREDALHLIARAAFLFETGEEYYTIEIPQLLILDPEKNYSIVLVAPYADYGDYETAIVTGTDYECDAGCHISAGEAHAGSEPIVWPLDYTLQEHIMHESSFVELIGAMQKLAKVYFHTDMNITHEEFDISQSGRWEVDVSTIFNMSNERTSSIIESVELEQEAEVSIVGMKDPLNKIYSREILITPEDEEEEEIDWTLSLLQDHYTYNTFIANDDAPDFIGRLQGDYSGDTATGISTLFYDPEYPVADPQYHTIDYKYLAVNCGSEGSSDQVVTVHGTPVGEDIYLDPETEVLYDIEDIPELSASIHACSLP